MEEVFTATTESQDCQPSKLVQIHMLAAGPPTSPSATMTTANWLARARLRLTAASRKMHPRCPLPMSTPIASAWLGRLMAMVTALRPSRRGSASRGARSSCSTSRASSAACTALERPAMGRWPLFRSPIKLLPMSCPRIEICGDLVIQVALLVSFTSPSPRPKSAPRASPSAPATSTPRSSLSRSCAIWPA